MCRPHHHLLTICLLVQALTVFATSTAIAGNRDPDQYFFDTTFGNFEEELETAREQGKNGVLLFFEMDECPYCHKMKQMVLNKPVVQDFYKEHFLVFSVDIEGDVEIQDFQGKTWSQKDFAFRANRVRATPVFAFYDLDGNRVYRFTGITRGVEDFIWLGEYVVNGIYRQMPFEKYKRKKQKQGS